MQNQEERHAAHAEIITRAAAGLYAQFGPQGVGPLAIAEGLIKAAAIVLIDGGGATMDEAAEIIEDVARALRDAPAEPPQPPARMN